MNDPQWLGSYILVFRGKLILKERTIKGKDVHTVRRKIDDQLNKWAEQEIKKRVTQAKKDTKKRAEEECEQASARPRRSSQRSLACL